MRASLKHSAICKRYIRRRVASTLRRESTRRPTTPPKKYWQGQSSPSVVCAYWCSINSVPFFLQTLKPWSEEKRIDLPIKRSRSCNASPYNITAYPNTEYTLLREPSIRCRRGICRCTTRQLDHINALIFFLLSFLLFKQTLLLLKRTLLLLKRTVLLLTVLICSLVGFKSVVRRCCQGDVNRLGSTL